uniref:(California timema) hypothetical protein n=1 Tax=Timema californicum TaxID=61474 RepID=A0A7R9JJH8_TIMCA|nr:unnamed protein product [Timema californicum]
MVFLYYFKMWTITLTQSLRMY